MGTFTTKIHLGGKAFITEGNLDFSTREVIVGQVRIIETSPQYRSYPAPCYVEEYMCVHSGIGSGTVYTYGKNIFATEEEAKAGAIKLEQKAYKQRAERDAYLAEQGELIRKQELAQLNSLKAKYENK